jgi:hypothetical protein
MADKDDARDLEDIMAEEISRGTRRQVKAVTRSNRRAVKRLADMLADENCSERAFTAAMRGYGLQEESEEFRQLWELWRMRHGRT